MEAARVATSDDAEVLAALGAAGSDEIVDARGGDLYLASDVGHLPRDASAIAEALDDDRRSTFVGTIDDVAVGMASTILVDEAPVGRVGRIEVVYVLPEARGVAVGEAMLDAITTWARDNDAVGLDAIALPGDRQTKNFFETFGLKARGITVHHRF